MSILTYNHTIDTFTPPLGRMLQRKCACGQHTGGGECEECRKKSEDTLQRAAVNSAPTNSAPPIVHDVLSSPGQPLDTGTRAFMEPRFGHDFSGVRVHTDERAAASARSVNALAYTVGRDVVFGAGQYAPGTSEGQWLLAHELTHTIQQEAPIHTSAAEDTHSERVADHAATDVLFNQPAKVAPMAAPPTIQFLKVSDGGFGRALEEYTNASKIPNRAIILIQRSPTFMQLVRTLDQNYVARSDSYKYDPEYDADYRIKSPAWLRGKRELFVVNGHPSFKSFSSPDNILSGDVISLDGTDTPSFIQQIAHEATHAARAVKASAPEPKTLAEAVLAGITDEVETRKSEAKVLGEVPDKDVRARVASVGSRVPAEVEQDITPAFMLTYLELFFFDRRLRETQAADRLSEEQASDLRKKVDAKPGERPFIMRPEPEKSGVFALSDYADVWFDRQTAKREWEVFMQKHNPNDADFAVEKKKLLQDHAKRFFGGRIAYQTP